jgi:predicted metal-binding membrane protein
MLLYSISALIFVASSAVTIVWSRSMPTSMSMPMSMSMTSFVAMWAVMMVAMMMPSLAPMLRHYHQVVASTSQTVLVGIAYFLVWAVVGVAVYPLTVALAAIEWRPPWLAYAVPIAVGVLAAIAGALRLTRCRTLPPDAHSAWRHGARLGLDCVRCCAGLMAMLLAVGMTDLRAMALVTAAITFKRRYESISRSSSAATSG